jgi:membrane-bound ClpP family serine protease
VRYKSGIEVNEGDIILFHRPGFSNEGTIRKIIQSNTEEASHWSLPDGGVLVEGESFGLIAIESLVEDEDIIFVRRAGDAVVVSKNA